jgi:hypothetical protein
MQISPNNSCNVSLYDGGVLVTHRKARILSYYKHNNALFALIYAFNEPSDKDLIKQYKELKKLKAKYKK